VPGTDWVGLDDDEAMRLIVTHLHECGVRSAAFATSEMTNSSTELRLEGFRRHADRLGLTTRPEWIILSQYTVEAGEQAARQLLSGQPMPEAIVCADDLIAIGALRACRELGIRVPADVQITGLDDIAFAAYVLPPLTTLAQPIDRMAEEALRLLSVQIAAKAAGIRGSGARLAFSPKLVIRESTGPSGRLS
jgi:LacI family transcriptional regulator